MVKTISQIMSRPVVTATRSETMAVAAARLDGWRVGALAVVDDIGVVGLVSEGDVVGVVSGGQDPTQITVGSAMNADPVTVGPDDRVREVAAMAIDQSIRHLCVVDGDDLVGMVSLRDLLAAGRRIEDLSLAAALTDAATRPQRRRADDPNPRASLEDRLQAIGGDPADDAETFLIKLDRMRRGIPVSRRPPGAVHGLEPAAAVASTWELAAAGARSEAVSLAMASALPVVIGSVHRAMSGTASAGDRPASTLAESVLHHLGGSLAPFRLAALDSTLRIIATGSVDAASVSISAGVAAGLGPVTTMPAALRVFSGPSQLGGQVAALRSHPRPPHREFDLDALADQRLPLLQSVLDDLCEVTAVRSKAHPNATVPVVIAAILDELGVPRGFEAPVLAVGRIADWIERAEMAHTDVRRVLTLRGRSTELV